MGDFMVFLIGIVFKISPSLLFLSYYDDDDFVRPSSVTAIVIAGEGVGRVPSSD